MIPGKRFEQLSGIGTLGNAFGAASRLHSIQRTSITSKAVNMGVTGLKICAACVGAAMFFVPIFGIGVWSHRPLQTESFPRTGESWFGTDETCQGRQGMARPGVARHGLSRRGMAGQGKAGHIGLWERPQ